MRVLVLFPLCVAIAACSSTSEPPLEAHQQPNVYGNDDRRDWYQPSSQLNAAEDARFDEIGQNTVGMFVRDRHLRLDDFRQVLLCGSNVDDYPAGKADGCFQRTLSWSVFSSSEWGNGSVPLCGSEPFALQPIIGYCSGTLIADNLVLTAGHCFDAAGDADTSVFVLNFRYAQAPGNGGTYDFRPGGAGLVPYWLEMPAPGLATIDRADVYHVVKAHFLYEVAPHVRPSGSLTDVAVRDYSIVELDRPVSFPHRPAPIEFKQQHPAAGTDLVATGFGKGLPLKTDDGAKVVQSWYCDPQFNPAMVCNTHDAYAGDSGGGVFTRDGRLLAAHRGSASDYELDTTGTCYQSRTIPDAVPDTTFPAAAHHAAWAIDEFCQNGFAQGSPLCGDPSLFAASCGGASVAAVGGQVCCQRGCNSNADCSATGWGGSCGADGFCRRSAQCFSGELWERDACGRPAWRVEGSAAQCFAKGDACESAEALEPVDQTLSFTLQGMHDHSRAGCGRGGYGLDRAWSFELDAPHEVSIELDGDVIDYSLYLRGPSCAAADEFHCSASDSQTDAHFEGRLEVGRYQLFVDSEPSSDRKPYWTQSIRMRLRFEPVPGGDAGAAGAGGGAGAAGASGAGGSGTDAGLPAPGATDDDGGGCSCRVGGAPSANGWSLLGLVLWALRRRRTARR